MLQHLQMIEKVEYKFIYCQWIQWEIIYKQQRFIMKQEIEAVEKLFDTHQRRAKSYQTMPNPQMPVRKSSTTHSLIKPEIRRKIFSYMSCQPHQSRITLKLSKKGTDKKGIKIFENSKDMPRIKTIKEFIEKQKQLNHIYREKMQMNYQQCFLFYMEILEIAFKREFEISAVQINKEASILIDCFQFVCQTLFEIGCEKLSFYFCVKAIVLCETFQTFLQMANFLFVIGKIAKKLGRLEHAIIFLKKSLEYLWRERKLKSDDLEIQIYEQLSQTFLQMNMIEESKVFAAKYQIGYVEKQNSKIIDLSKELVFSVQKRKIPFHTITKESMELLFSFDIQDLVEKHSAAFAGKIDQRKMSELMKINFQYTYDTFMQDDMFFYEIPLPLEIAPRHQVIYKRRSFSSPKFIFKKTTKINSYIPNKQVLVKKQVQLVKQSILFNFRGVGVCKQKLIKKMSELIQKMQEKLSKNC